MMAGIHRAGQSSSWLRYWQEVVGLVNQREMQCRWVGGCVGTWAEGQGVKGRAGGQVKRGKDQCNGQGSTALCGCLPTSSVLPTTACLPA